jgi:hypothetical protein
MVKTVREGYEQERQSFLDNYDKLQSEKERRLQKTKDLQERMVQIAQENEEAKR